MDLEEKKKLWKEEQEALRKQLILVDDHSWKMDDGSLRLVGGVDISFIKDSETEAVAALVVVSFPDLEVVYESIRPVVLSEPYIPGFLAFRECDHLVDMIQELSVLEPESMPQVVLVDGNGILHPRDFGSACHLGLKTGLPTIGVAKKLFMVDGLDRDVVAKDARELFKGGTDRMPLVGNSGKTYGSAVQSNPNTIDPIFVSVGHKMDLSTAVELVKCCSQHRIPEPVRQADLRSREFIRNHNFGTKSKQ